MYKKCKSHISVNTTQCKGRDMGKCMKAMKPKYFLVCIILGYELTEVHEMRLKLKK